MTDDAEENCRLIFDLYFAKQGLLKGRYVCKMMLLILNFTGEG